MISPYSIISKLDKVKSIRKCDEFECPKYAIRVAHYTDKNGDKEYSAKFYCCDIHAKILLDSSVEFR